MMLTREERGQFKILSPELTISGLVFVAVGCVPSFFIILLFFANLSLERGLGFSY